MIDLLFIVLGVLAIFCMLGLAFSDTANGVKPYNPPSYPPYYGD
jgi:hypothetical protein